MNCYLVNVMGREVVIKASSHAVAMSRALKGMRQWYPEVKWSKVFVEDHTIRMQITQISEERYNELIKED